MSFIWIYVLFGVSLLVGWIFRSRFNKYSRMPLASGLSGAEVAMKMLAEHGLTNVTVQSVQGKLTDHYNPTDRTVNLSPEVYAGRSVAAAAVAAHECGHAVQHAQAYAWLGFRSKMVPALGVINPIIPFILFGGMIMLRFAGPTVLFLGVILYAATTLFTFVTLPVEFDASRRALAWINRTNVTQPGAEHEGAKDALRWAAMTYVMAALTSLATLLAYVGVLRRS